MIKRLVLIILVIQTMGAPVLAQSHSSTKTKSNGFSAYGPEEKRFGAGLYLGEPTGFTFKGYVTSKLAINGIAAWGFYDKAFTVIGDVTYDFLDIPIDSNVITLPFYAGIGGNIKFNSDPNNNTRAGIQVPIGVAVQWIHHPFEVFAEIVPGMEVTPSTNFNLMGGVGARFYF